MPLTSIILSLIFLFITSCAIFLLRRLGKKPSFSFISALLHIWLVIIVSGAVFHNITVDAPEPDWVWFIIFVLDLPATIIYTYIFIDSEFLLKSSVLVHTVITPYVYYILVGTIYFFFLSEFIFYEIKLIEKRKMKKRGKNIHKIVFPFQKKK